MSGRKMVNVVAVPYEYVLHQNYPNPFNPVTRINFDLKDDGDVSLVVYDIMGREVCRLLDRTMDAGYHDLVWNGKNQVGSNVGAGVYFCRLRTPDFTKTIKMVLLK